MPETIEQYKQRLLSYSEGKEALDIQRTTADKLSAFIQGKSSDHLNRQPAPGKWSVAQILAHLGDAEVANSWRYRQILSTNAIPIQAYDQDRWAAAFDYSHRDPRRSLEFFRTLRASNLSLLDSVPRELWDNYGVHEERGNESIAHLVRMIAGHDVNHLRQIEGILGKTH